LAKLFKKLSLFMFIFLLSGCATLSQDEDYTKLYKDYFDYTLGDWTVVKSGHDMKQSDYFFEFNEKYKTWVISYIDNKGSERLLNLDNWK
jgi:hypothetical protein